MFGWTDERMWVMEDRKSDMRTRQIARLTAGLYEAENRTPNQILLVVFKLVIGLPLISLFFSDLCKMLMNARLQPTTAHLKPIAQMLWDHFSARANLDTLVMVKHVKVTVVYFFQPIAESNKY